jgi:hypothetical protein
VAVLGDAGPHPGLVRVEGVVDGPRGQALVLEACSGGTLIEAVANSGGRLPERVAARRVVAPLLRALAHLHAKGIVHRCAAHRGAVRRSAAGRGGGWPGEGPSRVLCRDVHAGLHGSFQAKPAVER